MCGIVAYIGERDAQPILLDALGRLEYRGYDSSGIATINGAGLQVKKKSGRIKDLLELVERKPSTGTIGISHTRWATHGEANDANAHPHVDQSGKIALVHNGVIDNYQTIKRLLREKGHTFCTKTDSEVLAHLVGYYYEKGHEPDYRERLESALRQALNEIQGTYGIALIHEDIPDFILGARRGSPLVLGIGNGEQFLASDTLALGAYTKKVVYLQDFQIATLTKDEFHVKPLFSNKTMKLKIQKLDYEPGSAELGDFPHFMLKEIFEQPTAIKNAFRGRISIEEASAKLGGLNLTPEQLREIDRIFAVACGTALHAAMVGENIIENLANIPMEWDYASEFRYRNCPLERNTLFFAISQSGETIDTLGGLREAKRKGFRCLGICNNVGSTIARESDGGVYMHAGPEIGVAATKSFVSQVTIFSLIGLLLGRMRYLSASAGQKIIHALEELPNQIETILGQSAKIRKVAEKYANSKSMLFMGRQANYPIALEGALKMKEITYIHAEGYPSSELKHGVIALVEPNVPSIVITPRDTLYEKNVNSIEEIKARNGSVIALTNEGDPDIENLCDDVLYVPKTLETFQPILNVVPLQLLSYHTAVILGRDVDKPRNLAKSVTVE
ncbi:MAG: glutamine--fructose-6-phosphate transaminase (isomerizing) [Verrucomicrobiota bacterium]